VDALGGYSGGEGAIGLFGQGIFLLALCLTAYLERLQFRLKATEASTWWASNGRDVVNVGALAAMWVGLRAVGFAGPSSLAIAATLVLVLSVLQPSIGRLPHPRLWSVLVALALGAPVLLAPRAVDGLFQTALRVLF
jgi:hypothetical protein